MDAETWMDANKAIELGFADELMQRSAATDEVSVPQVSMIFSRTAVLNSLMGKIAAKCKIGAKPTQTETKVKADSLMDRLNLIKNWR
jgi:ATP-dependent Clp protease protease subunit